jgi:hypothetical protein
LLAIVESHWGGPAGGRARNRRRATGGEGACLIVVEGMGRVFARKFGVCGKALPDFELSWLRMLQHELATQCWRPTPLKRGAFLVAYGLCATRRAAR